MPPVSLRSGLPNSKLWFLLGALLLGVLPLLLAALFLPDSLSKQIRKASRKEMIHSAQTLASLVDREFSKNLSIARSLAEDSLYRKLLSLPAGTPSHEQELREVTAVLKRTTRSLGPDFSGMFLCDATGKAIACAATGLPDVMGVGMDLSDRDYFN